jgi:hypothetical protein
MEKTGETGAHFHLPHFILFAAESPVRAGSLQDDPPAHWSPLAENVQFLVGIWINWRWINWR